VRSDGFMKK